MIQIVRLENGYLIAVAGDIFTKSKQWYAKDITGCMAIVERLLNGQEKDKETPE